MAFAGDLEGPTLEDAFEGSQAKPATSIDDLLSKADKPKRSLDDLLGSPRRIRLSAETTRPRSMTAAARLQELNDIKDALKCAR